MPLLPGKKNIGHNIKVERAAGKGEKQAVAIAESKARETSNAQKNAQRTFTSIQQSMNTLKKAKK